LLDIGSGAGFPGLALKVAVPELAVTLLEPVAKKRAFLKEVVRCCGFLQVEVRPERLRRLRDIGEITQYNAITARAVGSVEDLVAEASPLLKQSGRLYLWLSKEQAHDLEKSPSCVEWLRMLDVPHSRERVILIGSLKGGCST
ncbi:MAG: 16S rRNA (guanine(527)-N(7))-methyltransferase RsmG, partial [Terriglobia bacterium]